MKTLLKRIIREQRVLLMALALATVADIGVYFFIVRPLEQRSTGAASRSEKSFADLEAAEREAASAQALVSSKTLADQELSTFYDKVVPPDLASARRLTFATLPALARKVNVKYEQRQTSVEIAKNSTGLGHLGIRMVLQGEYENVRRFIYELESSPQFVIIDDVSLAQNELGKPITLTIELSTYYRLGTTHAS
jgi:hypothetical protein